MDTPTFKYWNKNNGNGLFTMRIESTYVKKFDIGKLTDCFCEADLKKQWDNNIEEQNYEHLITNSRNVGRIYIKNKA